MVYGVEFSRFRVQQVRFKQKIFGFGILELVSCSELQVLPLALRKMECLKGYNVRFRRCMFESWDLEFRDQTIVEVLSVGVPDDDAAECSVWSFRDQGSNPKT